MTESDEEGSVKKVSGQEQKEKSKNEEEAEAKPQQKKVTSLVPPSNIKSLIN